MRAPTAFAELGPPDRWSACTCVSSTCVMRIPLLAREGDVSVDVVRSCGSTTAHVPDAAAAEDVRRASGVEVVERPENHRRCPGISAPSQPSLART